MKTNFQKSFAWIPILIIFFVACAVGVGSHYYINKIYLPKVEKTISQEAEKIQKQIYKEEAKFVGELVLSQLYPNPNKPEMIKIKFNKDVDESTLNSSTIKLFAVGASVGSQGQRQDLSEELNYSYQKEERILIITSKGMIIGGCAACYYELQLTDGVKDLKGNSLKPAILPL